MSTTSPTARPASPPPTGRIAEHRLAEMERAIELAVDRDEFAFASEAERAVFVELEAEFAVRISREGHRWYAD